MRGEDGERSDTHQWSVVAGTAANHATSPIAST